MKLLFLANELDNTNGITSHLFNLCVGLQNHNIKIDIACGEGNAVKKFQDIGINVFIVPQLYHQKRGMINYIIAHIKIFSVIIKGKYDLVHSHHHYSSNIAQNICGLLSIKTVQTNHGLFPAIGRLKHFPSDYVIAVNDYIYNTLLLEKRVAKEKLYLIYNGIWEQIGKKKECGQKIKFISASRLIEEKGIQDFIKAVNLLDDAYFEKAEFCFAGEGPYERELLVLNKKLGNKVLYAGNIINLQERFYEYDVFVFTSKNEGLPMILIEAAFAGCQIITSRYIGINEIFNEKNGCLTYEKGNITELAEIIKKVIERNEIIKTNADKFQKIAMEYFNAGIMTNKTMEFYYKILELEQ